MASTTNPTTTGRSGSTILENGGFALLILMALPQQMGDSGAGYNSEQLVTLTVV